MTSVSLQGIQIFIKRCIFLNIMSAMCILLNGVRLMEMTASKLKIIKF